jgi:hypothetical protein
VNSPSWRDAGPSVRSVTLTLSTSCDHCAQPIPISGPVQAARCPHCSKDTPVGHLYQILCFAAAGTRVRSEYKYTWFPEPVPECARCGKGVPVESVLTKESAATTIPCPSCSAGLPTFPAPAWLKAQLPAALQVIGGDADVAREQGGVELAVDQAATKPIAMPCPSCGGGLTIQKDTERTIACQFCATSVFIPDELWKRLHPVKTMLRWTLTYSGKLTCEAFDKFEANARKLASSIVALIRINRDNARKGGFDLDGAIEEGRKEFQTIATGSLVELYEAEVATLRPPGASAPGEAPAGAPGASALQPAPAPFAAPQGARVGTPRKFPIGVVIAVAVVALLGCVVAAVVMMGGTHDSRPSPSQPASRRSPRH